MEQRSCVFQDNQILLGGPWKDHVLSGQDVGKEEPLFAASRNVTSSSRGNYYMTQI